MYKRQALKLYDLDLTAQGYDIKVTDGTWAETYDVLISTIKYCSDTNTRYELMHIAEAVSYTHLDVYKRQSQY